MSLFNGAQSFFLDQTVVGNSSVVDVTSIGMFFMYRPSGLNNMSGVQYPGITMFLTDVVGGMPNISNSQIFQNYARVEWSAIRTSSDASAETIFSFANPITLQTGRSYAFCWAYDSGEDFLPWTNIKGNKLVGTNITSPGPSSSYSGNYFLYSSIGTVNGGVPSSVLNYGAAWQPLTSVDAKFQVYAARYSVNSVPVIANLASLPLDTPVFSSNLFFQYISNNHSLKIIKPSPRVENIDFDIQSSVKQSYVGAQFVYQDTIHYPGGGVHASVVTTGSNTITANTNMSNGALFSWNTIYAGYTGDKFVIVDYGAEGVDVRKIKSIVSNTVVTVDEATTVANSAARIMIAPVAMTDSFNTSFLNGKKSSLMFLRDSSANSTVRFVGHSVDHSNVAFANAGLGYSNSNVLYVLGYNNVNGAITSNYPAVANLTTNSTGGVLSLAFSNVGAGFVNSAQVVFVVGSGVLVNPNVATVNTSAGANLVPSLIFGSTLKTEQTNNIFRNSRPVNIDVHSALAIMDMAQVANTTSTTQISTMYYLANNSLTPNGFITHVSATPQVFNLDLNSQVMLNTMTNIPVVASRSLEFVSHYSNGAINDLVDSTKAYSNNYKIEITTRSTNDWVALGPFKSPLIDFGRYIFNNDYTNEHTDSGNALARHITTVFNMTGPANTNQMAEDLRFFVSAWRPPQTDIQVYARIKNSTDEQAFSDCDWTRMELIDGSNNYSTSGYTDLTYGFQGQPNSTSILAGSVTTTNNSSVFTGIGTNWNVSLANNTLVKLYDPLFANNDFAVVLVTEVGNSTSLTVDQVFSTNTQTGIGGFELANRSGLKMDVLGYGHQAFNNIQYDNVVRYYNTSEHINDGFNIVQIKCLMLSPDAHFIPRIHNIRGIGVSA